MGCSQSVISNDESGGSSKKSKKRQRSTITSIASLESLEIGEGAFGAIRRRYGPPSCFKMDGYDIGLRVRV